MDPIFSAAIPEPVRIFGVRLLTLSLGRYRLLRRFNVAFVADGEAQATEADLFLGIFICGMTCREFLGLVDGGTIGRELKRWGKRIRKEIRREEHFNILTKAALFKRFLEEAARVPEYWIERDDPVSMTAHWSHNVEVALRSELGWSLEEIEEAPLAKAIADYFRLSESQGLVRLIAPGELEGGQSNAALLDKLFTEGNEGNEEAARRDGLALPGQGKSMEN